MPAIASVARPEPAETRNPSPWPWYPPSVLTIRERPVALIAVALLPLYTRYLTPADYGAAEVLVTGVIAASIVIRLGIIEALLRFYYQSDEVPDQVVKTAFGSLIDAGVGSRTVRT